MKKISISIFVIALILLSALYVQADSNEVYVSSLPNSVSVGLAEWPVNTLEEAYRQLGESGTIYLLDTIVVTGNDEGCFVAPPHSGKITITSAPDAMGALDLTQVSHFHFGGNTEWNSIAIEADEIILSADNHMVTMGESLRFENRASKTTFRGGHAYSGARVHLTGYTPCPSVRACTEADVQLRIFSGEYWSISSWFGDSILVSGGESHIYLGVQNSSDSVWVRYLCPAYVQRKTQNLKRTM